jgi:hypothetical protein
MLALIAAVVTAKEPVASLVTVCAAPQRPHHHAASETRLRRHSLIGTSFARAKLTELVT